MADASRDAAVGRLLWTAATAATILTTAGGIVAWGLKLEARLEALDARVHRLEAQVDRGILPRAEEKIKYVDEQIRNLQRRLGEHEYERRSGRPRPAPEDE